jgi:hypothetical protein
MHYCRGGFCARCEATFMGTQGYRVPISFRAPEPGEACAVCSGCDPTETTMMMFPAEGCSHWFCTSCCRELITWDEKNYHLDPRPFGCPPCPNGCDNPARGRQCYCDGYELVQEAWRGENPAQYGAWSDAEESSIYSDRPSDSRGKGVCPMCRRSIYGPVCERDLERLVQ